MWYEKILASGLIPDFVIRYAIRAQLEEKLGTESRGGSEEAAERLMAYAAEIRQSPIAIETDAANEQHYEVPAEFFEKVLGRRLKYSSGFWPQGVETLDASEEAMLDLYVKRARLENGQDILDLGCGWGSLSLYLAERFPMSRVLGVSNSATQRVYILARAQERGLKNLQILTSDMNQFDTDWRFDRIVSIEMFEHMRNYEKLFERVSGWLKPDGLLFVHVFAHREFAYPFVSEGTQSWMAKYFFTGGQMPSEDLFLFFQKDLRLLKRWRVSGVHYQKTCEAWLKKMDAARSSLTPLFEKTYGKDSRKWWVYWRVFFMACAELFGYEEGEEWFVSHYLFTKQPHTVRTQVREPAEPPASKS